MMHEYLSLTENEREVKKKDKRERVREGGSGEEEKIKEQNSTNLLRESAFEES